MIGGCGGKHHFVGEGHVDGLLCSRRSFAREQEQRYFASVRKSAVHVQLSEFLQ